MTKHEVDNLLSVLRLSTEYQIGHLNIYASEKHDEVIISSRLHEDRFLLPSFIGLSGMSHFTWCVESVDNEARIIIY